MRILIADDEEVVLSSLEGILQKSGHETDLARDGKEALVKTKTNPYDLILLDLAMPKVSGYDVLKEVRATLPDLPVIFITGTGEAAKVAQSIARYKLTAFIEKPFTPEQVLNIINEVISSKKGKG